MNTTAAPSPLREPLLQQSQQHIEDDDEERLGLRQRRQRPEVEAEQVEEQQQQNSDRGSGGSSHQQQHNLLHHHHHHHHHHHTAPVPWYRNSLQIMAMLSNYSTSYNVVNISLVLPILEQLLNENTGTTTATMNTTTTTTTNDSAVVASSLLAGMIVGQVVGGALGDASCLGLSRALFLVMMVQIIASLGSAIFVPSPSSSSTASTNCSSSNDNCTLTTPTAADDLYWSLAAFRFVLGIAAGAVYPLAACLSVEQGIDNDHLHHPNSSSSSRNSSISIGAPGAGSPPPLTTSRWQQEQEQPASIQELHPESSSSPPLRQLEVPHHENDDDADAFSQIGDEHEETNQRNHQQEQEQQYLLLQQQESARRVVWTFCTQGLGFWSVPATATLLLYTMPVTKLDLVWRIMLGLGSVPGFVLVYLQVRLYRHQRTRRAILNSSNSQDFVSLLHNNDNNSNNENAIDSINVYTGQHASNSDEQDSNNDVNNDVFQQQQHDCEARCNIQEQEENTRQHESVLGGDSDMSQENGNHHHHHGENNKNDFRDSLQTSDGNNASDANDDDAQEETVRDCELRCDSDGEVGTLLDSNADYSSVGMYRASEHLSMIRLGWWASLTSEPDLLRKLLGTAGTWFLFDVLFYGNTLFQPIVTEAAFGPRKEENGDHHHDAAENSPLHLLQRTATDSLLLTSIALPGYFVAALVMGRSCCTCLTWGMKIVQTPRFVMLQGFAVMAVLYGTIGLRWKTLQQHNPIFLLLLYSLTFFFANYGPNTTTFILPSLVFSPECRSTLNGLAAAGGKAGALAGATFFAPAADTWGDATVMLICSAVAVVAFVMTQLFVQIPNSHNHHAAPAANAARTAAVVVATRTTSTANEGE